MNFLQVAPDPAISTWLIEQSPVIVIMGVVIWWLAKRLEKTEEQKETLSKDVIKLSTLWEDKVDKGMERESQILDLLREIKDIVKK